MRQADYVRLSGLRSRPSEQGKLRADIEGLRAVAILAVVLFHADIPGFGGGFVGVDVFFVVSGFLITGLLWREANATGTVRLRRFYGARARRLLPASAGVAVVTMIVSALLLPPLQVRGVILDGIASALYVSNYRFIRDGAAYFGGHLPPSPFLHYWSLGVEEQFYLLWPALILLTAWLIRRVRRRSRTTATDSHRPYLAALSVVAALSFALSLALTFVSPTEAFYSLPARAWQLALGGLVALTAVRWNRLPPHAASAAGWVGLGMILLACLYMTASMPYPGFAALLPTLGAVLVVGAGCAQPSLGCDCVLRLAPMQAIGRVSYSWYLWHWPVLILAPAALGHSLGLADRVVAVLLAGVLAVLSLWLLENPLRFAPRVRNSTARSLGLGAIATATAVGVGAALLVALPAPVGRGAPAAPLTIVSPAAASGADTAALDDAVREAFDQAQEAVAASVGRRSVPSNLEPPLADAAAERNALLHDGCLRDYEESGQPECAMGDVTSATTVALVGDSHAAMWTPAFEQVAADRQWRLELLSKGSCPLMDLPSTNLLARLIKQVALCEQWRAQILDRLRANPPQLVVVSMWRGYLASDNWLFDYSSYDQPWLVNLTRLVQQLREIGAQVLVLGPIPNLHSSAPICLSEHLDDASACALSRVRSMNEVGIAAERTATEAGGGRYADLTPAAPHRDPQPTPDRREAKGRNGDEVCAIELWHAGRGRALCRRRP